MGLFSIFKTPVNDIVFQICNVYNGEINCGFDSKIAFKRMAQEAFALLRKFKRLNFSSAEYTYSFLPDADVDSLTGNHDLDREAIIEYVCKVVWHIRFDYYHFASEDKLERLRIMVDSNLKD